jgi:hypothetical protein
MEHLPVCNVPIASSPKNVKNEYSASNKDEYKQLCDTLNMYTYGSLAVVVNNEVLFNHFNDFKNSLASTVSFKNIINTKNIKCGLQNDIHKNILLYFNNFNRSTIVNTMDIYNLLDNYIIRHHVEYDPTTKIYKLSGFYSSDYIPEHDISFYNEIRWNT